MRAVDSLVFAAGLLSLGACEPTSAPPSDAGVLEAGQPGPVPTPPSAVEGAVARIQDRKEVTLQGPRVEAKAGDWMLKHAGSVAVIATDKGRLIDFGPDGGQDGIYYVDSVGFDALDRMHVEVGTIEPAADGRALHVVRRVLDKPLVQHLYYTFAGPALVIESVLASSGTEILAVTQGEIVSWGNVPTWVEGHGFVTKGGSFGGDMIARESHGLSYAACSRAGRLMARFSSPDLSGFHPSAKTGETTETVPAGGTSLRRSIVMVHGAGSLGDAAMALPCRTGSRERWALPPDAPPRSSVEVARCGEEKEGPSLRFAMDPGGKRRSDVELPSGCFVARLTAPGHSPGKWLGKDALLKDEGRLPRAGRLRWKITDRDGGAELPAKIVVRGVEPTPDPDWGEDGEDGAALHSVHTIGAGELPIPPGKYRAFVTRGPEWTLEERKLEVKEGANVELTAALARVVDTKGWIAADLHVHAMPSMDAPARLEDRVRSLAAVGVELAVATDHNAITDYGPAIRSEKLGEHVASIVGDEVTTRDVLFGHYNVFPLVPGAAPVPADSVTPSRIFAAARAAAPEGLPTVVQVNHPRMGDIGYLELLRLDARDVPGSVRRAPLADMTFDAIELFNGDHYAEIKKVERCLGDWYALLNAGYRTVATGNSDSHKITYQEAGVPRTWVALQDDRPSSFDTRSFLEALRAGRAIVSSGPFVRLTAGDQGPGGAAKEGDVELRIEVEAPSWVHVSKVELVVRGKVEKTWEVTAGSKDTKRFAATHTAKLARGDWIVVVVRGDEPMKHLHREGAKPFAFTNPIWVE